jgi:hypothetical protein
VLEKIEIASILVVLPTRNRGIVDMLAIFSLFVQQVFLTGGFKASALPAKIYRALLTAAEQLTNQPIVLIHELVELAKTLPGRLIVDDTSSPKYARLRGRFGSKAVHPFHRRVLPRIPGAFVSLGGRRRPIPSGFCLVAQGQ